MSMQDDPGLGLMQEAISCRSCASEIEPVFSPGVVKLMVHHDFPNCPEWISAEPEMAIALTGDAPTTEEK